MRKLDIKKQAEGVGRQCVASRLRKLSRLVNGIYNAELTAAGLTISQFNILTALAKLQPTTPAQISRVLRLEKSSLSRNLELMRRNGWIETEGDVRISQLSISAKGERAYARALPGWERAQDKCQKILGPEIAEKLQAAAEAF